MHDRERDTESESAATQAGPVPHGLAALDPRSARVTVGRVQAMQRAVGNRAVTRLIQRQPTGTTSQPVGDAVRPEVTGYLTAFAAASANQERNRLTVQAFWAVARAYRLSTKGLTAINFDPTLTQHDGLTTGLVNKNRESRVDLGPGAFTGGFEWFVHIVAHELEHVRQNLLADYRDTGDKSPTQYPVAEFLSYSSSVLQVGPTAGTPGRHPLQELGAPDSDKPPPLPALLPKTLANQAGRALEAWQKMTDPERRRYWPEFAGTRDKLLERLSNEAPTPLRPPANRTSPDFVRWRQGYPPGDDPFSQPYQDWVEANKTDWPAVKDVWKQYDDIKPPTSGTDRAPTGGVVGSTTDDNSGSDQGDREAVVATADTQAAAT